MKANPKIDARMRENGFVSVPEASEMSGLARSTLYDAIRTNKVISMSVSSRKYVQLESLKEFIGPDAAVLLDMGEVQSQG